jgi:hypothetical protein
MSLREMALSAQDASWEMVEVPEWKGAKFKVRSISAATKAQLLKDSKDEAGVLDSAKFYPQLLIATLVDPLNEQLVFQPTDRDVLNSRNAGVIERLCKVAARVCGLSDEGMEKNSGATGSVASSSGSPNASAAPSGNSSTASTPGS